MSATNLDALFGGSLAGVSVGRTDYGVDFAYTGTTSAHALGSGTIAKIGSGWGHTNAPYQTGEAVYIKLDTPVQGYPFMYYAEGTPVSGLKVGQRIAAGQQIMVDPGEVGFIPTPDTSTLYQSAQPSGNKFRQFLGSSGGSGAGMPSGGVPGVNSPGGPGSGGGTGVVTDVVGGVETALSWLDPANWVRSITNWIAGKALLVAATIALVGLGAAFVFVGIQRMGGGRGLPQLPSAIPVPV